MNTTTEGIIDAHLYTIGETCKILGIHRNALRRYTNSGKLAFEVRKIDEKTLYRGRDLRKLITTTI